MPDNTEAPSAFAVPPALRPWIHWRFKRFWLLVAVLAYILAGFFLVPWIVERVLVGVFEDTGRKASVAEVRSNPFTLTLELQDFTLRDTDGETLFVFDRLFTDFQASSLFRWAWTFKLIRLEGAHPFEERFAGTDTRLLRLLADLAADEDGAETPPEAEEPPPRAIIQRLEVTDARLSVTDRPTDNFTAEFGPITVEVDDVRTLPDHAGRQVVVFQLNDSDRVEWQGDLQLVPFRSTGRMSLTGASLPQTRRFLAYYLPFEPDLDRVTGRFDYEVALVEDGFDLALTNAGLEVDGLTLTMDSGGPPVLSLDTVRAAGGRLDLLDSSAALEALDLGGLTLRAALREDGSLSLLDLLPEAFTEPGTDDNGSPPTATTAPWSVSLARLGLEGGRIELEDRTTEPDLAVALEGPALTLEGLDLADGTVMPLTATATLSSGGRLAFDGGLTLFPDLAAEGRLELGEVAVAVAQPYVNPFLRVRLQAGTLDLAGDLAHGPDQPLALAGSLSIDDFDLGDAVREERLVAWERLALDRFEADLGENRVDTSVLAFEGLYGRFHIAEDLSTNLGDLLVVSPAAPDAPGDPSGTGSGPVAGLPAITVGGVSLDAAALDFSDLSLPLPFETSIRSLAGDVSTLSTTSEKPASVSMEGQVNEYGLARIEGEINAWDPTANTDITMVFRNLEISRLSPYTIQFAGYAIEEGRLDMDLGYVLDQRQLAGDNNIVIREMRLGDKVDHPDAGSLPLGLAVALLKDSEGIIDLDVPVEGDLDNPEFRIGGVIWQAIGNLITKAVTAPFRLLGSLVGVDSEDFGVMAFAPGRTDISPPDREKLVKLGEAMLERPELVVEVGGTWAPEADRSALQKQRVAARLSAWQEENPSDGSELSTARERRGLEALFAESFPGEALEPLQTTHSSPPADDPEGEGVLDEPAYLAALRDRLVAATAVEQAALEGLARERATAVLTTLREGQPEAELNATEVAPEAVEPAEDGTVPLELGVSAGD